MLFDLYFVSKLCSDILYVAEVEVQAKAIQDIKCLYNEIYDVSKSLEVEDYKLYWRYSMDKYFEISDYISYLTAITLSGEKKIYMLMDDYGEIWEDNISFLEELDDQELAEKLERERDIYDVRIPGKAEEDSAEGQRIILDSEDAKSSQVIREPRTIFDILKYSSRKMPQPKYLQNDLRYKYNLMQDLKLGYPKRRQKMVPVEEEITFRTVASKSKEKKVGSKKSVKSKSKSKSKSSVKKKSSKGKK